MGQAPQLNPHEIVQHGACLGLGLAAMATENLGTPLRLFRFSLACFPHSVLSVCACVRAEVVDTLLNKVVKSQSAVAGEAAGYALGLVLLGRATRRSSSSCWNRLATRSTKGRHRARFLMPPTLILCLCMCLDHPHLPPVALALYGRGESADSTIERMLAAEDAILRFGGVHAVAMAYCGSANNKAIRKLLHVAVSDVNDDVRRGAVTALGFVLLRYALSLYVRLFVLTSVPGRSRSPHGGAVGRVVTRTRYGAALPALRTSAMPEAVDMLETLAADNVDFVRQGAYIALAMVLVQCPMHRTPSRKCKMFEKVIQEKHEPLLAVRRHYRGGHH